MPGTVTFKIFQQLFQYSILQARYDLYKMCADRNAKERGIKVNVLRRSHHSLAIIIAMRENLVLFLGPIPVQNFSTRFR